MKYLLAILQCNESHSDTEASASELRWATAILESGIASAQTTQCLVFSKIPGIVIAIVWR